jgi:hypothetical protein
MSEPVLAHQALLHALPFVVPAFVVVLVVAVVIWRDRRGDSGRDG